MGAQRKSGRTLTCRTGQKASKATEAVGETVDSIVLLVMDLMMGSTGMS